LAALAISGCLGGAIAQQPHHDTAINDHSFIDYLNSLDGASWVSGKNSFFGNMTFADAKKLLGTQESHISKHLDDCLDASVYDIIGDDTIPAEFDARTKWPGLIHPIRDQQQCGSCWAFSASEVLSDRVAIATGEDSPVLSAEDLVSCDRSDMGCQGGRLDSAWQYMENTGLVTDSCFPYTAGAGNAPACATQCVDSESFTKTKAKSAYAINGATNMQKDIMTNGPIQVAFKVYKSFMTYNSGVYKKHSWEVVPEGGHAVKMVGWGTESGQDYWLVANSWNTNWGLDGFFKIARGDDQCGIETMGPPYAGMPAVVANTVVV
jgi:cathepsin B